MRQIGTRRSRKSGGNKAGSQDRIAIGETGIKDDKMGKLPVE